MDSSSLAVRQCLIKGDYEDPLFCSGGSPALHSASDFLRRQGREQRSWKVLQAAARQLHAPAAIPGLPLQPLELSKAIQHFLTYLNVEFKPVFPWRTSISLQYPSFLPF